MLNQKKPKVNVKKLAKTTRYQRNFCRGEYAVIKITQWKSSPGKNSSTEKISHYKIGRFLRKILNELVESFGKKQDDAIRLIRTAGVYESLTRNPLGLHDSPHEWALKVLTKANDYEALSKYYGVI